MEYNFETSLEDYSGRVECQSLINTWPLKVKEKVNQVYYKYGLLCSSHPWIVITITLSVFFVLCYPILGTHLFHNSCSQKYITFIDDSKKINDSSNQSDLNQLNSKETPKWVRFICFFCSNEKVKIVNFFFTFHPSLNFDYHFPNFPSHTFASQKSAHDYIFSILA